VCSSDLGHGFDWTTVGLSTVGLALDLVPPAKGPDILVTVIKNTKRLCGGEVADRLVKVSWEMASDKTKRNALLKMSGFMATEIELLPRLLKNADDMTEFGKFFAKYGNEAEGLLKKFGPDLADEMFEVFKIGGDTANLKEVLRLGRKSSDKVTFWLEKGWAGIIEQQGKGGYGWKHIVKKHITQEIPGGTPFPSSLSQSEIQDLVIDSVKTGTEKVPNEFYKTVTTGGKTFEILTIIGHKARPGQIITSYPTKFF
jgi:hypothetical protein